MSIDDRFEDLAAALGGFYRTWFIDIGLELGLFAAIRAAGDEGLTPDDLAARTETHAQVVGQWAWGADAHGLVDLLDGRLTLPEMATMCGLRSGMELPFDQLSTRIVDKRRNARTARAAFPALRKKHSRKAPEN